MKRFLMASMILLMAAGCLPESTDIQTFTEKVTLLSSKVDTFQETTTTIIDTLADVNLVNADLVDSVDNANEEIDCVQLQMVSVAEAINNADYVSGDDIGNVIKAAKAGTVASAAWNPYAAPILVVLNLIEGVVLLLVNRSKNKEAAKRDADKAGREKTLREIAVLDDAAVTAAAVNALMYSNIGEARRAIT